jgi:2-polyprenyl-3-methyl-5-hydroxy-6-metoxy-1,4-benzoquinol methylase
MSEWRKQAIKIIDGLILGQEVKSSIEVGCDDAGISRKLAKKYPDILFEGVDYREDKIKQANQLKDQDKLSNVHFNYDYFLNIQEIKQKYDIVIFTEVYEHLVAENQIYALRLLGNLLSENGVLVFSFSKYDKK